MVILDGWGKKPMASLSQHIEARKPTVKPLELDMPVQPPPLPGLAGAEGDPADLGIRHAQQIRQQAVELCRFV